MAQKRVWIYCRIAHQSPDNDFAMTAQVRYLTEYAAKRGLPGAGVTTEYGNGLTRDRPGLKKVTDAVKNGKAEAVLVKNLSRIARSYLPMPEVVKTLNQYGAELISADEGVSLGQQEHF